MTQTERYANQPAAGALCVLAASFIFALMGALIKVVSCSLNNEMVVFFRNACALVFILPWFWFTQPRGGLDTTRLRFHLLRSVAGLAAMYCFFYSIAHLKLSESYLLAATSPLFIPVFAYMWLREPVAKNVKGAIVIGFIGIVLILKPGFGIFQPTVLVGLGAGVFAALAMVSIRSMSASEPVIRIVLYFTALSTLFSAAPLPWFWQPPRMEIWWMLLLIGFLAAVGQFLLTKGYSYAPAAQVGPFTYANVMFAVFIGWAFWEEKLDLLTWAGAALICIAGIVTTRQTETHALVGATARTLACAAEPPDNKD